MIAISVNRLIQTLSILAVAIVVLDLAAMVFALVSGHDSVFGLLGLLDLDKERGIGMLFQVLLLIGNAALFLIVSKAAAVGKTESGPWLFLSFVFLFLTLDEFAFIHERLMPVMRALVGDNGVLYFAWIVPYGLAVAVLAVWIAPKIFRLSPEPRFFFVMAAICYVGGALGMEALGGWRMDVIGGASARPELVYELLTTIEESLEMAGLLLLSRALLGMVRDAYPTTTLLIED